MPETAPIPPAPAAPRTERREPRPIRRLPALVASQIAAGEVVERPASVVKELVDNALDAGATRISVELEQGGIELVRVSDDGQGIPSGELALAVAPHATSKIESVSDLDHITTMGFRGEALASIASVARLFIRSRTLGEVGASVLEVEGGTASPVRPESGPVGTSASVRNLFFNTPARRKFLRQEPTEQGHCADIVRALAMANPSIGFRLTADGRTLLDLPPDQGPRERVLGVIGAEMESQYCEAHADTFDDARGIALWGLVGLPGQARQTTKWQHVFLNGRPIRDKTIQHALKEAYRGLIEPSRHPSAVLMIAMDPGAVDVNVHPSKSEVRFRDSGLVHSVVHRAVREALRGADLTPSVEPGAAGPRRSDVIETAERRGLPGAAPGTDASRFADYFRHAAPPATSGGSFDYATLRAAVQEQRREGGGSEAPGAPGGPGEAGRAEGPFTAGAPTPLPRALPASRVLQVHNSYLVTQDEHGVLIIDQHALHERVMFEKLKERLAKGELESQRLLMPAVVGVPVQRLETLERLGPMLLRLGIEAAAIGRATIGVHAFPTFLFDRKVDPAEFLGELLERAEAEEWGRGDEEAALHEVLDMMACKAAVKAGDALSEGELGELIEMRERVERSSNCPHGRPTTIRMTIKELERRFGRT